MKTRSDLFYNSEEIFKIISPYKNLKLEQILKLYPNKENIRHSLNMLIKSKRVFYFEKTDIISTDQNAKNLSYSLIQSFWVLLDFIEKVKYHFTSDYPIQISFFKDGELFDIVYVALGDEALINSVLNSNNYNTDNHSKKLVIIEKKEQIPKIHIKNTLCYCEVDSKGKVSYYKQNFE